MKKISVPEAKQLPSGAYRCWVKVDGKKYSFTAAKKAEAEEKARGFKLGYLDAPEKAGPLTVSGAIDLYLAANEKSISPSTKRGYKTIQKNRLQSLMTIPVSSLTDAICKRAINSETRVRQVRKKRVGARLCRREASNGQNVRCLSPETHAGRALLLAAGANSNIPLCHRRRALRNPGPARPALSPALGDHGPQMEQRRP